MSVLSGVMDRTDFCKCCDSLALLADVFTWWGVCVGMVLRLRIIYIDFQANYGIKSRHENFGDSNSLQSIAVINGSERGCATTIHG